MQLPVKKAERVEVVFGKASSIQGGPLKAVAH